jgi:drug/metabolite transporter (DMT)-like permease
MTPLLISTVLALGIVKMLAKVSMRYVSPYTFSVAVQLSGVIVALVVLIVHHPTTWAVPQAALVPIVCAGILWSLFSLISYAGVRETEVSIRESVMQTRILFSFALSAAFGAIITPLSLLSGACVFAGVFTAARAAPRAHGENTSYGIAMVTLGAFASVLAAGLDKVVVSTGIDPIYYALMLSTVSLAVLAIMGNRARRAELCAADARGWFVAATAATIGTFGWLGTLFVYRLLPFHIAFPSLQVASVIAVLGSALFLGDRGHLGRKTLGFSLAIAGAVLLRLAS